MNNREVNAVIHNSQFTIHNYDYRNSCNMQPLT